MRTTYYNKPEDVLFIDPLTRFLTKIFGAEHFVIRCKVCNKIPTDVYGDTCIKHI